MSNKTQYFILSDGYQGGAITFLGDHIKYLNSKKQNLVIIDKSPKISYPNSSLKNEFFKLDLNKNHRKTKQKLKKIIYSKIKDKNYLLLTNYALILKYFSLLKEFKNKNNKIILTIHSGIYDISFKSYLAALIFSMVYTKVDYLIFGSISAKLWWHRKFPWMNLKKKFVRYNGVKLIKRQPKSKKIKKKVSVSFVGRLEKENDPDLFISIANEYLKKNKNVIFNIYGNGQMYENLKKKYSSRSIVLHGWRKKELIYKNSDIVLITSPINNYPYVALEAKSYGIPVISCSKGDISKIIKNNIDGYLNPSASEKDMVNMIKKTIKNYEQFSRNSIKNSRSYEDKVLCKKFWKSIL